MAKLMVFWDAGSEEFELDDQELEEWRESGRDTFYYFDAQISSVFPDLDADVIE